jgi:hypothetical protein
LLVERRNRFCASNLAAARRHGAVGDVLIDGADRRLDHLAAVVGLGDDAVGVQLVIKVDGTLSY